MTFRDVVVRPPHSTVELLLTSRCAAAEITTPISVDVDKLPVAYASIAQAVNDSSELLRSTFRREQNKKKFEKKKSARQVELGSFFQKKSKK